MKLVKYLVALMGLVAGAVALVAGILSAGGQGMFALSLAFLPPLLVGISEGIKRPFGRLFASLSFLSFMILAMKTTEDPFTNVMMAAAAGALLSLVLLIRPEKAKKKS